MKRRSNYFLRLTVSVFLICAAYVLLPSLLLWRTGETHSPLEIADWQQQNGGLWDSVVLMSDEREAAYKNALNTIRKPEVITLGSSLVLGFRQQMFAKDFANLGRGFDYFRLDEEVARIIKKHSPEMIIYAPDLDKYNENSFTAGSVNARLGPILSAPSKSIIPDGISRTWSYVLSGKLPVENVAKSLFKGRSVLLGPRIGLRGSTFDFGGYGPDGSYYYFDNYSRPQHYTALLEKQSDAEIQRFFDDFWGAKPVVSQGAILRLQKTIDLLKSQSIDFVVFLPAYAHRYAAAVSNNALYRQYFQAVSEQIQQRVEIDGGTFFDFTDPRKFNAKLNEFMDAQHIGDVASARLLLEMARQSLNVSSIVNHDFLGAFIRTSEGLQQADVEFIKRFIVKPGE